MIVGIAALEFFQTVRRVGFRPSVPVGVLASVAIVPIAYARGEFAYPFVLALTVVFSLLWFMFRAGPGRPVVNVAMTIGGFAYVGGLAGFAGLMLSYSDGIGLLLGLALCVIAYDAAGYLVGTRFGRTPLARIASGDRQLLAREIGRDDIATVVERIGAFGGDNRAGISGTLHRISALRNRSGVIVGLTCRVGRAVPGAAEIIADEIASGRSILLLGAPGVGKTTILREAARLAAERRRRRSVA